MPRIFGVYHDAVIEWCKACDGTGEVIVSEDVCCAGNGCPCMGQPYYKKAPCTACGGEG